MTIAVNSGLLLSDEIIHAVFFHTYRAGTDRVIFYECQLTVRLLCDNPVKKKIGGSALRQGGGFTSLPSRKSPGRAYFGCKGGRAAVETPQSP